MNLIENCYINYDKNFKEIYFKIRGLEKSSIFISCGYTKMKIFENYIDVIRKTDFTFFSNSFPFKK